MSAPASALCTIPNLAGSDTGFTHLFLPATGQDPCA